VAAEGEVTAMPGRLSSPEAGSGPGLVLLADTDRDTPAIAGPYAAEGLLDPAGLPVAGGETAKKLVDETGPSNTLMRRWAESAGTPPALPR
jgi:hypothetical protein